MAEKDPPKHTDDMNNIDSGPNEFKIVPCNG